MGSSGRSVSLFVEKAGNWWSTDGGVINVVACRGDGSRLSRFRDDQGLLFVVSRLSEPLIA